VFPPWIAGAAVWLAWMAICIPVDTAYARPRSQHSGGSSLSGVASVYDYSSGATTASGERQRTDAMTAAHPNLPFGTRVRVTNHRNGQTAIVRINDRGPFVRGRVIDLSPAAARALGISGTAQVSLAVVETESAE
jgi:peptidoglycan lytic transglycosylase